MHFILKQILNHEESNSNRKGVNPLWDELGIGSVIGVVADRFGNWSVGVAGPLRGSHAREGREARLGRWLIGANFSPRLNRE
jgi:hypothetical protein